MMLATTPVVNVDPVRQKEISSIRAFVEQNASLLTGRVLDYGAGKPGTCREPQPYRSLLTAAAEYVPYDVGDAPPEGLFDSILCTQVLQYVPEPQQTIHEFSRMLKPGGILVLTYATNWEEAESSDLWRFTRSGMAELLKRSGFTIEKHERRAEASAQTMTIALGYGVVARKRLAAGCTLSADASARILTQRLRDCEPYFFVRYGDGALECIFERDMKRNTCDGEVYSEALGRELLQAWKMLDAGATRVFAGDWQSASFSATSGFNYETDRWKKLTDGVRFEWIHFESLLLMRQSAALVDFYRAVRNDPRPKVYLGPSANQGAGDFLRAQHVGTPMTSRLLDSVNAYVERLMKIDFEILLFGAGLAGNIIATKCWEQYPDRTYISLGSALDPLFRGRSRKQQLQASTLRQMFSL